MLLLGLCWYFQPSQIPIFAFLVFQFMIKLFGVYSQTAKILSTDVVPVSLRKKFDSEIFHKARSHSLSITKLKLAVLLADPVWKMIKIGLGSLLFEFAIKGFTEDLEVPRKLLRLHWLTLELISVTAFVTLAKRLIFMFEPVTRILYIDEASGLNEQSWDDFLFGFYKDVVSSIVKNCAMVSIFCEISSIIYDIIGFSWPSLCIAYWIVYVGIKSSFQYWSESSIAVPNEKFTPISKTRSLLPKFIKLAAQKLDFPENNILISDNSERSVKQNISLRGLVSQKLILDDNMLAKYEKLFNPPIAEYLSDQRIDDTKVRRKDESKALNDCSELMALVTVQIAHWKFNHAWTIEVFDKMFALLSLGILSLMMAEKGNSTLGNVFGLGEESVAALLVSCYLMFEWGKQYIKNSMRRSQELQADSFAVKAGYAEDLKGALIAMYMNNLEFPVMTKIYENECDHNSLVTRLEAIDRVAATCSSKDFTKLFIHALGN